MITYIIAFGLFVIAAYMPLLLCKHQTINIFLNKVYPERFGRKKKLELQEGESATTSYLAEAAI